MGTPLQPEFKIRLAFKMYALLVGLSSTGVEYTFQISIFAELSIPQKYIGKYAKKKNERRIFPFFPSLYSNIVLYGASVCVKCGFFITASGIILLSEFYC